MYDIVIAQIEHETNTFSDDCTTYDHFNSTMLIEGNQILKDLYGSNTVISGFLRVSENQPWNVIPSIATDATPGGIVTSDALIQLLNPVLDTIHSVDPDGVLIALHGAMVSETHYDGDAYIIEQIREAAGGIPILATLDFHANVSDRMIEHADGLFGYDTYPHTDMATTGETAAKFLAGILENKKKLNTTLHRFPLLIPLPEQITSNKPMSALIGEAKSHRVPGKTHCSIFGGFPYADVPVVGASVVGCTVDGRLDSLSQKCDKIMTEMLEMYQILNKHYYSVEEINEEIQQNKNTESKKRLLLADISDNPGGGAYGDDTTILSSFLSKKFDNVAFALISDKFAVSQAIEAGVGEKITLKFGNRQSTQKDPIEIEGIVRTISDGRYSNKGKMSTGVEINLGPTVVFEASGITIIISSNRQQPYDPEIFARHGIDLSSHDIIVVKSSVHYRASFEELADKIYEVNAGGLCNVELANFEFTQLEDPIFAGDYNIMDIPNCFEVE